MLVNGTILCNCHQLEEEEREENERKQLSRRLNVEKKISAICFLQLTTFVQFHLNCIYYDGVQWPLCSSIYRVSIESREAELIAILYVFPRISFTMMRENA